MTMPNLIILPTDYAIMDFKADVQRMTNHDYDMGEIIKDVFKALEFLPDCNSNIKKACELIVSLYSQASAPDDGLVLANGFGKLAYAVKQLMVDVNAWDSSGIIRVSYHTAFDNDWVVKVDTGEAVDFQYRNTLTSTPSITFAEDSPGPITKYFEDWIKPVESTPSDTNNENNSK